MKFVYNNTGTKLELFLGFVVLFVFLCLKRFVLFSSYFSKVLGDFDVKSWWGEEPHDAANATGGNSPSSSRRKQVFGGVSAAAAISWNFSESKKDKNDLFFIS